MKREGGRPSGVSNSSVQPETFGWRLRHVRESAGLEQADFAKAFGVTRNTQGGYERNQVNPSLDYLVAVCQAHNVSADWLLLGKAVETPESRAPLAFDPLVMEKCSLIARHLAASQAPPMPPKEEAAMARELYEFFMGRGRGDAG